VLTERGGIFLEISADEIAVFVQRFFERAENHAFGGELGRERGAVRKVVVREDDLSGAGEGRQRRSGGCAVRGVCDVEAVDRDALDAGEAPEFVFARGEGARDELIPSSLFGVEPPLREVVALRDVGAETGGVEAGRGGSGRGEDCGHF
jgi:hypothetical protein